MYHRFASTILTCKYTGLLRAAQGIRRKFFGGHAKTAIPPRPGVVPPCKPAIDRPTLTDTDRPQIGRTPGSAPDPDPQPIRFTDSPSPSAPPLRPQTYAPRISAPDTPAFHFRFSAFPDISGHRRFQAPPGAQKTPAQFPARASGYRMRGGELSPPPVLFSAGITPRPLSWQRLSWPTWPRQPPWRSSERPVRRCRRASSSRPRR